MRLHIGIFGGTFDPPHIGHLLVASHARRALGLDVVKLVVANDPWQKTASAPVTPAAHRLAMTHLAVRDLDGLEVSDTEIRRGGPSYTVDTVEDELARGAATVSLIVGRDAALGLDTWHRADDLRRLVEVVVADRPGARGDAPGAWRTRYVDVPQVDVSSTDLRRRLAVGEPVDVLIPRPVIDHIDDEGLYTTPM